MMLRRFCVSLLFAALCYAKPNFSGQWTMDASKSDFGPMPAPEKIVRVIDHKEPNLNIKTTQVGQQGEVKSEYSYTTDGKEFTAKSGAGEIKGTATWAADDLVVKSKRQIQNIEIDQTDRWSLSADGKTLKV